MPQVIVEQPGVPPMTVPIMGNEIRFGRAEDSDVVLVAEEVSRNHAKILRRGQSMVLVDLKSLNGTYVNRQRIVERVLSHLDEIWLGSKCRVVYRDDTNIGQINESGQPQPAASRESQLQQSMNRIKEEMDRVGNSMTMMGMKTPVKGVPVPDEVASLTMANPAASDEIVRMGKAYRRLSELLKASEVMSSNFDLRVRLAKVLDTAVAVFSADRGFVMLREPGSNNLNVKVAREMGQDLQASSPSMGIAGRAAIDGQPVLMVDSNTNQEFGMRESIIRSAICSAMCVPLKIENRILGSIYVDSRKPSVTFNEEDLELFAALAFQFSMAIDNVQLHEQMVEAEKRRQNFGRFLSPAIVEMILTDGASLELGGKKTTVTTLFCDIRGSTQLAERLAPHELVALLNEHFTAMTEIIFQHQGTLDKYIGDELMAVFGAPIASEDDPYRAACAALAIQEKNRVLNELREREGRPPVHVGIGIDTGEAIAGYIGSPMRMEFTVVGDRVNTAKRFCDIATAGKVVAGHETYEAIKDLVAARPIGTILLKGKQQPVHAHEIVGLK